MSHKIGDARTGQVEYDPRTMELLRAEPVIRVLSSFVRAVASGKCRPQLTADGTGPGSVLSMGFAGERIVRYRVVLADEDCWGDTFLERLDD